MATENLSLPLELPLGQQLREYVERTGMRPLQHHEVLALDKMTETEAREALQGYEKVSSLAGILKSYLES